MIAGLPAPGITEMFSPHPTAESRGDNSTLYLDVGDSWTGEWYGGDGPKKRELFA